MLEHIDKKDWLIGGAVVVGLALVTLFLKGNSSGSTSAAGTPATASSDVNGSFATAGTIFVPTTSQNYDYSQNYGTISTLTANGQTTVTDAPTATTVNATAAAAAATVSPSSGSAPIIVSSAPTSVNLPSAPTPTPTATAPKTPAPAPAPKPQTAVTTAAKTVTAAVKPQTPTVSPVVYKAYGSDAQNSSLWGLSQMYLENHGGVAKPTNSQIQAEVNKVAALNNIKNPNVIQKGQSIKFN